jgi:hypothetical protein
MSKDNITRDETPGYSKFTEGRVIIYTINGGWCSARAQDQYR